MRQAGQTVKSKDDRIVQLSENTRLRLLETAFADWKQHVVNHPEDPEQMAFVVCPGSHSCPLCRKPTLPNGENRFPVSNRNAVNVWSYSEGALKILIGGPQIFKEFDAATNAGFDILACDWTIQRAGKGLTTKYTVVRGDKTEFTTHVEPAALHDTSQFEKGVGVEAIFDQLEKFGIDYDALPVPSYTPEQALGFAMPWGQYKGMTLDQILKQDQKYLVYFHDRFLEQGALGDGVFLAIHTALESRGMVPAVELSFPTAPATATPVAKEFEDVVTPAKTEPAAESEPAPPDTVTLVDPNGGSMEVPTAAADALLSQGWSLPTTESPAEETFTPPGDSDPVDVIMGNQKYTMTYSAAKEVVASGAATFVDARIAGLTMTGTAPAAAEPADPDKPFVCEHCGKGYKNQGGLTAHQNKGHAGATQPPATPAETPGTASAATGATNGGSVDADLLERVKNMLAKDTISNDYDQLIELFRDVAGVRNISSFDTAQLEELERRLVARKEEAATA